MTETQARADIDSYLAILQVPIDPETIVIEDDSADGPGGDGVIVRIQIGAH